MARRSPTAIVTLVTCLALAAPASAQLGTTYEWSADRPDGVSPVGVIGDRTYDAGEMEISYRFQAMRFDGNRIGSTPVSLAQVLDVFFVAPVRAEMSMHLFGLRYAPADELTLEMSAPFLVMKAMDNVTADGRAYETDAGIWEDTDRYGFGDVKLLGHVPVYSEGPYRAHLTGGVSVPVGSIRTTDVTPLGSPPQRTRNTYPMQIGSGTWDLLPGFTVFAMNQGSSAGIRGSAVLRLHDNDLNYRLGNRFEASVWGAFRFTDYVSASFRFETQHWTNISGADPTLNRNLNPAANPDLQGGTRVDLPMGLNFYFPDGILEGHRLGFEAALPLYQELDGPQLEHDWTLTFGWEYLLSPDDS